MGSFMGGKSISDIVLECLRSEIKNTHGTDMYVVGECTGHAKFCKLIL